MTGHPTKRYPASALEQERENLGAIFDAVNVGMLLIDGAGTVKRVNSAVTSWIGRNPRPGRDSRPGDILRCVNAVLSPHGCGKMPKCRSCEIRRSLDSVLRSNTPVHGVEAEFLLSGKDGGSRLWLDVSADPVVLGGVRHAILVMNNVTERKLAQEGLLRLNRTLKALSDSRQAMMVQPDEKSYLREVCRNIVNDCGYSMCWIGLADDGPGKLVRAVAQHGFDRGYIEKLNVTWADTRRGRGPTGTAIRTSRPVGCRNMLTDPAFAPWRKEARKRGYASSISLPLLQKGKAFGALTIYAREPDAFDRQEIKLLAELADDLVYGISYQHLREKQKQAEDVLRRDKQTLKELVQEKTKELKVHVSQLQKAQEVGNIGSWFLDVEKDELSWSREASAIFGLARGERLRMADLFETVHPDDRETVVQRWEAALRGEPYDIEHRIVAGGVTRWVRHIAELEFGRASEPLRAIGIAQDITARKDAEAENTQLQQEITHVSRHVLMGEFSSALAHELNQPLAAILSNAQAARRFLSGDFDPGEIRAILDDIVADSARAGDVIRKMRLLLGKGQLNLQEADICAILRETASFVGNELALKRVKLTLRCPGPLATYCDRTQIQQVMLNLIRNSCEAVEGTPKKSIHIAVGETGRDNIVITTRDTGKGFSEEDLSRSFQPFYTTKESGMGMGLAISKRIIESHGGRMEVRNHPKGGAVVLVTLKKAEGGGTKNEKLARVHRR